ncbi:MAG TPA: hypothetical protein VG711_10235 [Phycisphaerales bacterium]|nr:hypothetical protein [Phycisphaerales bacterium]
MPRLKNHIALSIVASALFCTSTFAQSTPSSAPPQSSAANSQDALITRLQSTLVDADYDRVDFEKIIDDLRTRYNLNIHVSWNALESAGIRRDQRIEIHLKQIPLSTLLDLLLREAAGSNDPPQFIIQSGIIIITTESLAHEQSVLRSYDITDLIGSGYALRRFANTPVLSLNLTGREFVGGEDRRELEKAAVGSGGASGLFGDPGDEQPRLTSMERVSQIVDLIQENIEPETWRDLGGDQGSLQLFNNTLLINQSLRAHQQIADFLNLLRSTKPAPVNVDAAIVRLRSDRAADLRKSVGNAYPHLTTEQADQLAFSAQSEGVLFRATSAGTNGKGLLLSALTQQEMLSGLNPVVAQNISAFQPVTSDVTSGLELIVLPLISSDSLSITVDVQAAWSPTASVYPRQAAAAAPDKSVAPSADPAAAIDLSKRSMRTVSSAATIRLGDAVALTIPAQLDDRNTSAEYEDLLIIRPRLPK